MENVHLKCSWIQKTTSEHTEETGEHFLVSDFNTSVKSICRLKQLGVPEDGYEIENILWECLELDELMMFLFSNEVSMTFEEHRSNGIVVICKIPDNE